MREHFGGDKEILSVVFISVMKGMLHVGNVLFRDNIKVRVKNFPSGVLLFSK